MSEQCMTQSNMAVNCEKRPGSSNKHLKFLRIRSESFSTNFASPEQLKQNRAVAREPVKDSASTAIEFFDKEKERSFCGEIEDLDDEMLPASVNK